MISEYGNTIRSVAGALFSDIGDTRRGNGNATYNIRNTLYHHVVQQPTLLSIGTRIPVPVVTKKCSAIDFEKDVPHFIHALKYGSSGFLKSFSFWDHYAPFSLRHKPRKKISFTLSETETKAQRRAVIFRYMYDVERHALAVNDQRKVCRGSDDRKLSLSRRIGVKRLIEMKFLTMEASQNIESELLFEIEIYSVARFLFFWLNLFHINDMTLQIIRNLIVIWDDLFHLLNSEFATSRSLSPKTIRHLESLKSVIEALTLITVETLRDDSRPGGALREKMTSYDEEAIIRSDGERVVIPSSISSHLSGRIVFLIRFYEATCSPISITSDGENHSFPNLSRRGSGEEGAYLMVDLFNFSPAYTPIDFSYGAPPGSRFDFTGHVDAAAALRFEMVTNNSRRIGSNPKPRDALEVKDTCSICMTHPPTASFDPCGHLAACDKCASEIVAKDAKCPICRCVTNRYIKVYTA